MQSTVNHERFLQHLSESENGVWLAARWLHSLGYNVKVNCMSRAATHGDWKKHADNGDLEISQRVEVKHLKYDFTCKEDWPHKPNFMVCAKHAWDNARPKPFGFIYLNKAQSHVAVLMADTHSQWRTETTRDRRYDGDYKQQVYMAPMDAVKFFPIERTTK